jgi:hypothetical protein
MTWQPVLRPFLGGFDVELDDIVANDGKLELARRAPRTAGVGGQTELIQGDGAYAMELELEPADASSLRVSMPPRPEVGNMLLSSQPALPAFTRAGVQSRVRHRGDSVLAVLPVRWPRSVLLSIPSMGSILDASGQGHTFELSDKGHYGRWLAAKAGGLVGLHDLLLNPRSQAIISTFREHHLPGRKPTGAYRRFLSFAEMSVALRDQRRLGFIARRRRGALLDEEWLRLWIDQQVSAGVLRAGVWTRCRQCLAGSFLAFGSFAETFACPRCGAVARTPAVPKVGYQLAEVAHLFLANDCDMTALALSALARRSHGGFSFDFDHNVMGPKGQRNELDFFAIIDGRVYIGESKKGGDFDRNDFDVMKRVARATRARAVVLATGAECEDGCTDKCQRDYRRSTASSDTALASGGSSDGVREKAASLRAALAPSCQVIVLCRGDLSGSFRAPTPRGAR